MAASVPDPCLAKVLEAANAEREAIQLDRANDVQGALAKYSFAERALGEAAALAPQAHAEDQPRLDDHRKELLARIGHLRELQPGEAPCIPVEDQVHTVQLAMQGPSSSPGGNSQAASGVGSVAGAAAVGAMSGALAGAAAVGAVSGAVMLGPVAPVLGAVVGAASMGYATTRSDGLGSAARSVGTAAATAGGMAASAAGTVGGAVASAAGTVGGTVGELDRRYQISSTVQGRAQRASTVVRARTQEFSVGTAEVAARGRESRGAGAAGGYQFGDLTRGMVVEGKECRGASAADEYRFGDLSRGILRKVGWSSRPAA